jgi:hypothetical protein
MESARTYTTSYSLLETQTMRVLLSPNLFAVPEKIIVTRRTLHQFSYGYYRVIPKTLHS